MAGDVLRIKLGVDPSKHPLLAQWLEANRWVWQEPARDLLEQALREGRLPAVLPVRWPKRAKTRQGGAGARKAARKASMAVGAGEEQSAAGQAPQAPSRPVALATDPAVEVRTGIAPVQPRHPDVVPESIRSSALETVASAPIEVARPQEEPMPLPAPAAAPMAGVTPDAKPAAVHPEPLVADPAPPPAPVQLTEEELMRQRTKDLLLRNQF